MRCEDAASTVTALADGAGPTDSRDGAHHVEHCLRCQAELAQHRKVRRALSQFGGVPVAVPEDLVEQVLDTVAREGNVGALRWVVHRHRAAAVAAATAATAAGAFVIASRTLRPRLAPAG